MIGGGGGETHEQSPCPPSPISCVVLPAVETKRWTVSGALIEEPRPQLERSKAKQESAVIRIKLRAFVQGGTQGCNSAKGKGPRRAPLLSASSRIVSASGSGTSTRVWLRRELPTRPPERLDPMPPIDDDKDGARPEELSHQGTVGGEMSRRVNSRVGRTRSVSAYVHSGRR